MSTNQLIPGLLLCALFAGCASDGDPVYSVIDGDWRKVQCELLRAGDESRPATWRYSTYRFTNDGEVLFGSLVYSDADCVSLERTREPGSFSAPFHHVNQTLYSVEGPEMLSDGLEGYRIETVRNGVRRIEGFFHLDADRLCLSASLVLESGDIDHDPGADAAVDFDNCLVRV